MTSQRIIARTSGSYMRSYVVEAAPPPPPPPLLVLTLTTVPERQRPPALTTTPLPTLIPASGWSRRNVASAS